MLLVDNLMHADLHPGNILIQHVDCAATNSKDCRDNQKIVLVDAGVDPYYTLLLRQKHD